MWPERNVSANGRCRKNRKKGNSKWWVQDLKSCSKMRKKKCSGIPRTHRQRVTNISAAVRMPWITCERQMWYVQFATFRVDVTHLDVCQVVVHIGTFGDAVALVEVECRSEHVFTEPHLSKSVEESLVIVVSHAAAILNLANHVSYCDPWHALRYARDTIQDKHLKIGTVVPMVEQNLNKGS